MRRSGLPAPDIPALAVIAVVLWCAPSGGGAAGAMAVGDAGADGVSELVKGGSS